MALIACSRMYNAAPGVKAAWDRVFAFVGERSGIALDIVDHLVPASLSRIVRRQVFRVFPIALRTAARACQSLDTPRIRSRATW